MPARSVDGDEFGAAREALIEVSRYLAGCGFHAALAGNLSARLSEDCLICTRTGANKHRLQLSDLLLCDLSGRPVEGKGTPTSEIKMHLIAYRERADVRAVIHAHPPTATAFAAASVPLDVLALPEMIVHLGAIALVPYATPGTEELACQLQKYLPSHDGFLLENHGALSVGRNLQQACQRMELIEQNARVTLAVRRLGNPFRLDKHQLQALLDMRSRVGGYE